MMSGNAWNPAANATTRATGGLGASNPWSSAAGATTGATGGLGAGNPFSGAAAATTGATGGLGGLFGGGLGKSIFGSGYQSGSLGDILSGLFGNASSPYDDASNILSKYLSQIQGYQNPFYQAGTGAVGDYQNWLKTMQDPSAFINQQMGNYQQSPWAKYEQQQAIRAGQNAASVGGLSNGMGGAGAGSTPFAQQLQQNASNISSQDMQNYLGNVLGVNQQYGSGLNTMMGYGANAANNLSNILSQYASAQAGLGWGGDYARQQQQGGLFSGLAGLFGF